MFKPIETIDEYLSITIKEHCKRAFNDGYNEVAKIYKDYLTKQKRRATITDVERETSHKYDEDKIVFFDHDWRNVNQYNINDVMKDEYERGMNWYIFKNIK